MSCPLIWNWWQCCCCCSGLVSLDHRWPAKTSPSTRFHKTVLLWDSTRNYTFFSEQNIVFVTDHYDCCFFLFNKFWFHFVVAFVWHVWCELIVNNCFFCDTATPTHAHLCYGQMVRRAHRHTPQLNSDPLIGFVLPVWLDFSVCGFVITFWVEREREREREREPQIDPCQCTEPCIIMSQNVFNQMSIGI